MDDIHGLLQATREGDARAADLLMPLVYEHLRTLARHYMRSERPDHTLRPTAIVHDAYLKPCRTRSSSLRSFGLSPMF